MKAGDYVRTKQGRIGKISDLKVDYSSELILCEESSIPFAKHQIIKSSPNILELLEPMDLLYIDIGGGFEGGIVVPRMVETQNELNDFVEFIKSSHWILKGVVTHEQLKNCIYKVGE